MFDTVADHYFRGRPDMPLEAVQDAARVLGLARGARVLEVGAGTGALTAALAAASFDVVALEPGAALRARLAARIPAVDVVASTFEEYEPASPFDAVCASCAWHWIDPEIGYAKAANVAGAILLLWNMPIPAEPELFRRVQDEVMAPRGSTFPNNEADARAMFAHDAAGGRVELAESELFDEPWWRVYERDLPYTRDKYVSLILSMGHIAAAAPDTRDTITEGLRRVLPQELVVRDLVYAVAAKVKSH